MAGLGTATLTVRLPLGDFQRQLDDLRRSGTEAFNKFEREAKKSLDEIKRAYRQAIGPSYAVAAAVAAVGTAAGIAGLAAVRLAADFEQTTVAFTTMLGGAEAAQAMLQDLADFAARTPFELTGLTNSARLLTAFGIEAQNIIPFLNILGDVSAGVGADVNQIAMVFGQVRTAGRLMTQDLRQFLNAGIPLLDEFASMFGVTTQEVQAMVTAGEISFAELATALQNMTAEGGQFFNMMANQSATLLGQWSNLQDNISQIGIAIGQDIMEAFDLTDALRNVNEFGDALRTAIQQEGLFTLLREFDDAFRLIAAGIAGALVPALINTVLILRTMAIRLAPFIALGIVASAIVRGLSDQFSGWGGVMQRTALIIQGLSQIVFGITDAITALTASLASSIRSWFQFFGAIADISQGTNNPLEMARRAKEALAEGFEINGERVGFLDFFEPLDAAPFEAARVTIGEGLNTIQTATSGTIEEVGDTINEDFQRMLDNLNLSTLGTVNSMVNNLVGGLDGAAVPALNEVDLAAEGAGSTIGDLGDEAQTQAERLRESIGQTSTYIERLLAQIEFHQREPGEVIAELLQQEEKLRDEIQGFVDIGLENLDPAQWAEFSALLDRFEQIREAREALRDEFAIPLPGVTANVGTPSPFPEIPRETIERLRELGITARETAATGLETVFDWTGRAAGGVMGLVGAWAEAHAQQQEFAGVMAAWQSEMDFQATLGQYIDGLDVTAAQSRITEEAIRDLLETAGGDASLVADELAVLQARLRELGEDGPTFLERLTTGVQGLATTIRERLSTALATPTGGFFASMRDYQEDLAVIEAQTRTWGESFDALGAKISATEGFVNELIRSFGGDVPPWIQRVIDRLTALVAEWRALQDQAAASTPALTDIFGPGSPESEGGTDADVQAAAEMTTRLQAEALAAEQRARQNLVNQLLQVSSEDGPLAALGKSALALAVESIPAISAAVQGFVTGGPMGALGALFAQLLSTMEPFLGLIEIINGAFGKLAEIVGQILAPVFRLIGNVVRAFANAVIAAVNFIMNVITFGLWRDIENMESETDSPEEDEARTPSGGLFGTERTLDYRPNVALNAGQAGRPAAAASVIDGAQILLQASMNFDDTIARLESKLDVIDRRTYNAANALR